MMHEIWPWIHEFPYYAALELRNEICLLFMTNKRIYLTIYMFYRFTLNLYTCNKYVSMCVFINTALLPIAIDVNTMKEIPKYFVL
jgi:hypothetical protein